MIMPLLISMAIGLTEIGFLVIDYMTVTNAARSGVRTGAAAADTTGADDVILNVVEEDACNLKFGTLTTVIIYKAEPDGSIPVPPGTSVNRYQNTGSLMCGTPGHGLSCTNGCPWTPAMRDRIPPDFDNIGIEVTFTHNSVTGLFPFPTVTWTETAVMQVEPDTRGQQ